MESCDNTIAPSSPLVQRLAIIGLGLIGASIGLACRARGVAKEIHGADEAPDHCRHAMTLGVVDRVFPDAASAVEGADMVVLAVPVGAIAPMIERIAPHLAPGAVVTDVGSVKGPIAAAMEQWLPGGNGVPGHPIAGREISGPQAAAADLFVGAKCAVTPSRSTDPAAVTRVCALWKGMGSEILELSPERHDEVFAAVSHLPHVVAYALIGAILDLADDGDDLRKFAAGGLRDFTRVAMSHPAMWRDICLANRRRILEMIERFQAALDQLTMMITIEDAEGLYRKFERARASREDLNRSHEGDARTRTGR